MQPQLSQLKGWRYFIAQLTDFLSIFIAGHLAFVLYFSSWISVERYQWVTLSGAILGLIFLNQANAYVSWRFRKYILAFFNLCKGYFYLTFILLLYLYFSKKGVEFSRMWIGLWLSFAFLISLSSRLLLYWAMKKLRIHAPIYQKTVILIGERKYCRDLNRSVRLDASAHFKIVQTFLTDELSADEIGKLPPSFAPFSEFNDKNQSVNEIWIALPLMAVQQLNHILKMVETTVANIRYIPDFQGIHLINHQISYLAGHYSFDLSFSPMHGRARFVKALEDKVIALFALILASPIMLMIALWIKCTSKGSIIFKQSRISWNGQAFDILKFRTMPVAHGQEGQWGHAKEKKMIPLGKFLRRFSLDELPQLWNVLRGDMSLVGPRPEQAVFVERFREEIPGYMRKHLVKAGITGWAQLNGLRGDTDLQQRIEYDLWYIENWSLWLDLKIIFLTIAHVFFSGKLSGE